MLQPVAPKYMTQAQAIALPFDDEESFTQVDAPRSSLSSLYALAIAVRVGFLAAILLKIFAIWRW